MAPLLLLVTGPPGAGKTTLARRLSADLHLPVIHRDAIKEQLFDTLGWRDREWSQRLGAASFELLYDLIALYLQYGHSLIAESNLDPDRAGSRLRALHDSHPFRAVQVMLSCDPIVLAERCRARTMIGQRHPGHIDDEQDPSFEAQVRNQERPVELSGIVIIRVDTTDFQAVDYDSILKSISANLIG